MLNHHTSPGRSPFGSPQGAKDLMARQRDEFGKSEEPVRGLNLDGAGATPHFAARCVTWTAGSLQSFIVQLCDEFRPLTGEERESAKLGFHTAPVKKVIISVSTSVCTQSVTQRAFYQRILNGFGTEESESSGVRTTEMGGSDPIVPRNRGPIPPGFGGHSRLFLLEPADRVLAAQVKGTSEFVRQHVRQNQRGGTKPKHGDH